MEKDIFIIKENALKKSTSHDVLYIILVDFFCKEIKD